MGGPAFDRRGFFCVGLYAPKDNNNIGSALRAVGVFGGSALMVQGRRYSKHPTDVAKIWRHIPLIEVDSLQKIIPYNCVPVAVDMVDGAKSLPTYTHPERAFYVFGPEDGTLDNAILGWCRDIVCVPTNGCMNLAAAVSVVLYDRAAKAQLVGIPPARRG